MASFCVTCGVELEENHKFCGSCGSKRPKHEAAEGSKKEETVKLNLSEFMSKREEKRKKFFKSSSSSKQQLTSSSSSSQSTSTLVNVLVGRVERNKFGDLKPVRGKRIPVQVKSNCTSIELVIEYKRKHAANDQEFCAVETYYLLHPDMQEVIYIPDSTNEFVLERYKKYLGKPYSQLLFYLCIEGDFFPPLSSSDDEGNKTQSIPANNGNESNLNGISNSMEEHSLTFQPNEMFPVDNLFNDILQDQIPDIQSQDSDENKNIQENVLQQHHQAQEQPLKNEYTIEDKFALIESALKSMDSYRLRVRRKKVWQDTFQKLGRVFKDGPRPIVINFVGEEADDAGGPLKEFFTILFEDAKNHLMVCGGQDTGFTLLHDQEKLKRGEFFLFGNLIALSLIFKCAGPRCFSKNAVNKMFLLELQEFLINEVPDLEIQKKLFERASAQF